MERKIFLVSATLREVRYMGRTSPREIQRLVWAASAEEAEAKFRKNFEVNEPYGTSVDVITLEVTEAIE